MFLVAIGMTAALCAGETPVSVLDSFDSRNGRMLGEGEWAEYLVAYPLDPLTSALAPNPPPPPASATALPDADPFSGVGSFFQPVFDPPVSWLELPLRLEVTAVEAEGLRIRLTFEGAEESVFLPLRKPDGGAPFRYLLPQPEDTQEAHRVGGVEFRVTETRRRGPRGGFVRRGSPELPFGLARYATENLDISLVDMGEGEPPAFPSPYSANVSPAPGTLYTGE